MTGEEPEPDELSAIVAMSLTAFLVALLEATLPSTQWWHYAVIGVVLMGAAWLKHWQSTKGVSPT